MSSVCETQEGREHLNHEHMCVMCLVASEGSPSGVSVTWGMLGLGCGLFISLVYLVHLCILYLLDVYW